MIDFNREPTSKFVVSYWHIPGGYDYSNATVLYEFYDTEEEAVVRARCIGGMPPEMADVYDIATYDRIRKSIAERV